MTTTPHARLRRPRRLALALAGLALAGAAAAEGYPERYAQLCAACHGADGQSAIANTPSLGGQPAFYTISQLFLYRNERRDHPIMVAVTKPMTDDDLRGFSDLVAKLPPPLPPAEPADPQRLARGRATAEAHRCLACHGPDGSGGRQVARVAGQREDYLQLALRGFKAGTRVGYVNAMNEAMAPVPADEIDDLAHFLAHLK